MNKKEKLLKKITCTHCSGIMQVKENELLCLECGLRYKIENNTIITNNTGEGFNEESSDVFINKLKIYFKKYTKFFNFLYYTFGAVFVNKNAKAVIKNINDDKLILNLGSGVKEIRKDVVNVDFYSFQNVDLVADISKLPLANNSVDVVISEFVFEHVVNYQKIIQEIYRVLKPEGLVYISVPFIEGFHSSPYDYQRWTKQGVKELMSDFIQEELKIRSGPASALVSILQEWLAILLCFGSKKLQQFLVIFFMIILSPIKLLDYFMYKLPNADNISFAFYYLGRKK